MACFIAPAVEAAVLTVVQKHLEKKESEEVKVYTNDASVVSEEKRSIPWSKRLSVLNGMLWGGSALLMVEHIAHGEIIASFPFLTAVANGETLEMLKEIATVGGSMAVVITAIWAGAIAVAEKLLKKQDSKLANLIK